MITLEQSFDILDRAVVEHRPVWIYALFSGGYDSLVNTRVTAAWAKARDWRRWSVAKIDTRTGIDEADAFADRTAYEQRWPYQVLVTPERYERLVLERGFPGPAMHPKMYDRLKGRCIDVLDRQWSDWKDEEGLRRTVMYSTGVRKRESQRRMGYVKPVDVRNHQVWVNPCFDMTKDDVLDIKERYALPSSVVVDTIHMSGECGCGAMAKQGEWEERCYWFPRWKKKMQPIVDQVHRAGFPWGWGETPPKWWKKAREGQLMLFEEPTEEKPWMPLCVGCEGKHAENVSQVTETALQNEGKFVPKHRIQQVANISARSLARQELHDDPQIAGDAYQRQIVFAATALKKDGRYIDYQYKTQYTSGATLWTAPHIDHSIVVYPDGKISQ